MITLFDSVESCETGLSHCNHVAAKRYSFEQMTGDFLWVEPHIFGGTVSASLPVKVALHLSVLFLFKSKPRSTLFLLPGTAQQLVWPHFTHR